MEIEAYHLEQAATLLRELEGSADPELLRAAVTALRQSAENAEARGDTRGVMAFATRALALGPADIEERLEIEILLADAHGQRGDTASAAALGERVAREARAIGRRDLVGRAQLQVALDVWVGQGKSSDKRRAVTMLREAAAELRAGGDRAHEADALYWLGYDGWWDGDPAAASRVWEESLTLAHEMGDPGREVRAALRILQAEEEQGNTNRGRGLRERTMELAPATSRLTQALIWSAEADRLIFEGGDRQAGERLLHDSLTVAEEADQLDGRYNTMVELFYLTWVVGDLPAAVGWAERLVTLVEEARHGGWVPEAHRHLAQVLVEQGDISAAETHALRAVETVAADDVYSVASSKQALGEVRDRQGRTEEAGELLAQAVREAHSLGFRKQAFEFDLSLALFQLANGRTAEGNEAMVRVRKDAVRFFTAATPILGWIDRREAAARARSRDATA